ncbi:phage tail assembly protein [Anaeroselena agilis]|uniref:Phage tail assembly protein n=1 Tax=Anaeroselena agilis TaxID=3063788 RepID=A0ABU3NYF3_9FIRM|nr:phage tail assembly protein [Selenomonadales bacterium 4137-cl]
MIYKLQKPHTAEGKEYTELNLDLEKLSGRDLVNAAREARLLGDASQVPETSHTYLAVVAAKAASVNVDVILSLPAKDFTAVKSLVQDFLL